MVSTKYVKDYRMDTETDKDGKVKRKMIYTGPLYFWSVPEDVLKKLRIQYLVLALAAWTVFVSSLLFYSNLSRVWYVIVPYVCVMLVLLYLSMAVYNLYTLKEPMWREGKEKTSDRIKASAMIGIVLCAGALAGEIASCIVMGFTGWSDLLFMAATLLLFLLMLYGFKASKQLQVSEKENPAAAEWKDK